MVVIQQMLESVLFVAKPLDFLAQAAIVLDVVLMVL